MRCGLFVVSTIASVALVGCHGCLGCTSDARSAVIVDVTSPEGVPIDAVTANGQPCLALSSSDGGMGSFACFEQGDQEAYVVRVTSGSLQWTKGVNVEHDGCHVEGTKRLMFVITPATAD